MSGRRPGTRQGVALLGSTGSIGRSTLEVLRRQREHFEVLQQAVHGGWTRQQRRDDHHRPRVGGHAAPTSW